MAYSYTYPHPAVTTDIVLFSLIDGELEVLLIRRKAPPFEGRWALPGGFLEMDETLEACAARELREETGIQAVKLTQFHAFSAPDRDPRERVVSVAFFGVLPADGAPPSAGSDAAEARWHRINALPPLAFDHADIIRMAEAHITDRGE
jgi:8-oxo-dGTP diphosphatase